MGSRSGYGVAFSIWNRQWRDSPLAQAITKRQRYPQL